MKPYYHNKVILFSVVLVAILSLFNTASALADGCDDCIHSCQGMDHCCTGSGCVCYNECLGGHCDSCSQGSWVCGGVGDCWYMCTLLPGPPPPLPVSIFFDQSSAPMNPTFFYTPDNKTDFYNARILRREQNGNIVNYRTVLETSTKMNFWQISSGLNPDSTYYFQVQSVNSCNDGNWSDMYPFTTSSCWYSLLPQANAYSPPGGTGTVNVETYGLCHWTVTADVPWITITSASSGFGNGIVSYSVSANTTGNARLGSITIGGQGFRIRQVNSTFADDPRNVFTPYINAIYTQGIAVGCGNGNYCPSMKVTRGQMAAFIIRSIYGDESFNYTMDPWYFSDVPSNHTFFKYVQKMKDTGITAVTGTYDVDGTVTRGQMAAFIIRALYGESFVYTQAPYFTDVPTTHVFFKYVQKLKDTGITVVSLTYDVDGTVTRDQMAAFLARAFLWMQ
jgi:hypothetical protein